jgi:hypothetical protein
MMQRSPFLWGKESHQILFHRERLRPRGKAESPRNSEDVGINRDRRNYPKLSQYDVRCLATNTWEGGEIRKIPWKIPIKLLRHDRGQGPNVLRFCAIIVDCSDQLFYLL